jgi:hypothetical protein
MPGDTVAGILRFRGAQAIQITTQPVAAGISLTVYKGLREIGRASIEEVILGGRSPRK